MAKATLWSDLSLDANNLGHNIKSGTNHIVGKHTFILQFSLGHFSCWLEGISITVEDAIPVYDFIGAFYIWLDSIYNHIAGNIPSLLILLNSNFCF